MEEEYVRAFLEGELGRAAKYKKLDPSLVVNEGPDSFNPFFHFLDRFRDTVERKFDIYWVDGGKPELFSVAQVEPALVTFSSRYIELVFVFRHILGEATFDGYRWQAVERTALRVMAELAVYQGNLEFAYQAFIRSLIGEKIHVFDWSGYWIHELSEQPIDEGFVANWFFGLAHELGHLNVSAHPESPQGFFSENDARLAIDFVLKDYGLGQEIEDAIRKSAEDPSCPLCPNRLFVEAYADLFAVQIILRAAHFLMEKVGATADMYAVLTEVQQCMTTLWILERCKASAQWTATNSGGIKDAELYIPPIVLNVRQLLVRKPLEIAVTQMMSSKPSARDWLMVKEMMNQISHNWEPLVKEVLSGLEAANRFVFLPNEERRSQTRVFTSRSIDLRNKSVQMQIKSFCSLIESLHGDIEYARRLRNVVASVETE